MGWAIIKDHISDKSGDTSAIGEGQRGLSTDNVEFRLYDDDGILYFEGLISRSWLEGEADLAFAPLDWAKWYAGCTSIHFKNEKGEWEEL